MGTDRSVLPSSSRPPGARVPRVRPPGREQPPLSCDGETETSPASSARPCCVPLFPLAVYERYEGPRQRHRPRAVLGGAPAHPWIHLNDRSLSPPPRSLAPRGIAHSAAKPEGKKAIEACRSAGCPTPSSEAGPRPPVGPGAKETTWTKGGDSVPDGPEGPSASVSSARSITKTLRTRLAPRRRRTTARAWRRPHPGPNGALRGSSRTSANLRAAARPRGPTPCPIAVGHAASQGERGAEPDGEWDRRLQSAPRRLWVAQRKVLSLASWRRLRANGSRCS